jgi:hypothetical protein
MWGIEWIELAQDRYDNGLGCGGMDWFEWLRISMIRG